MVNGSSTFNGPSACCGVPAGSVMLPGWFEVTRLPHSLRELVR